MPAPPRTQTAFRLTESDRATLEASRVARGLRSANQVILSLISEERRRLEQKLRARMPRA